MEQEEEPSSRPADWDCRDILRPLFSLSLVPSRQEMETQKHSAGLDAVL